MARKRKNPSKNEGQDARIVVEYKEGTGTTVRVDKAFSPEHAVWMLAQAIQILVTQGGKEESADEPVQELSDTVKEKFEEDLSNVPE